MTPTVAGVIAPAAGPLGSPGRQVVPAPRPVERVADACVGVPPKPIVLYAQALRSGLLYARDEDGRRRALPVERWVGALSNADRHVLDRARGPVLDVGCGPGRHVAALTLRGIPSLGLDIAPCAVRSARGRGAEALLGSVFDTVVTADEWQTVLLLDGNIGIGGHPRALLARAGELLRRGGEVICEVEGPGAATTCERVALEDALGTQSSWFAWARVGVDAIAALAHDAGMHAGAIWHDDGRWFAILAPPVNADQGARIAATAARRTRRVGGSLDRLDVLTGAAGI